MQTIAALNLVGLSVEVLGVVVLGTIDFKERRVLEAQTRLDRAHLAYLQNMNNENAQHYLSLCNRHEDRALVDSYDPRHKAFSFRTALWLLGTGMLTQLVAAAFAN